MKDIRNRPLNERREGSIQDIFDRNIDAENITEIASFMGYKQVHLNGDDFKERLIGILDTYLSAEFVMTNYRSEKEENKVLEKIARNADQLYLSLVELFEFGQTNNKLAQSIKDNPTKYTKSDGTILADLLDDNRPNQPLFSIREFISDLYISAERSINKKPTSNTQWQSKVSIEDMQRWKQISQAHNLPTDYALQCLTTEFANVWSDFSDLPFTEGMHIKEVVTTQHVFRHFLIDGWIAL